MYRKIKTLQQLGLIGIAILGVTVLLCCGKTKKEVVETAAFVVQDSTCFSNVTLCGIEKETQKLELFEIAENEYFAFIPAEMRTDVYVFFDEFKELQIGDVTYKDGEELTDIYKDSSYTMLAKGWNDEVLEEASVRFYFCINIPSIYVATIEGNIEQVNEDKSVKEQADFAAFGAFGEKDVECQCTIKSRGNTSFQTEQKSYSINLDSAKSVLGMEESSEWVLLANYQNTTQQYKNKVMFEIAQRLGMKYTPDSCYVNLYVDNQYNGLYLLTQKVSADGGAVQFDYSDNYNDKITGPYLLEFDARYETEPIWFKTNKKNVVVKYPKNKTEKSIEYIENYMKETETAIFATDGINPSTGKSFEEYIDLESWAKMYLMQEFFVQWDVEFASFYLYKLQADPMLYAGPVWDFDLAYGNMFPGYYPTLTEKTTFLQDNKGGWLGELAKYPVFQEKVKGIYLNDFSPTIHKYLDEEFMYNASTQSSSAYMNAKRWARGEVDVETDAAELYDWTLKRSQFMDAYMLDSEKFEKVRFQFGWGTMSYHVESGEKIGFLPCKEYGEIDYLEDRDYGYGKIIGWMKESGEEVFADLVITEETDLYPIYE